MKAAFGAEAIGLNTDDPLCTAIVRAYPAIGDALGVTMRGGRPVDECNPRPWVAEIVGPHPVYRWERRFLRPRWDYSRANGAGTRGIWWWWTLESGRIYEARYRTSWGSGMHRRLMTVGVDGDLVDLTEEEVEAWVSDCSASTS